ncbi:MAG: hypothetical protein R6X32_24245 [Chloroflexota bacterium]
MDVPNLYTQATVKTGDRLKSIAHSPKVRELSSLSLPEVDAVVNMIARVAPAGNVPAVILNGLIRLPERKLPLKNVKRDINLLFKGIEQALVDKAVYSTFFAGPAAVIWAYQNLLRLAGKDPDASFPEGVWQFYVDYAMRDDTARHANETAGFDAILTQNQITLPLVDRIAAWAMTAIYCLHQYDALLENEWRERVYTYALRQAAQAQPDAASFARLYRQWETVRPYARGADVEPHDNYPTYRRKKFDQFLALALSRLPDDLQNQWRSLVETAVTDDLPPYQQQMSILAYLEPGEYGEVRVPIPLTQAHVGLIYREQYYLLPACQPNSDQPANLATVRAQIAALLTRPSSFPPAQLYRLATVKRRAIAGLRPALSSQCQQELDLLRLAPIWLNCDRRRSDQPLSLIRQAERGVGDHPLTLFDTGETFVFDQSHIFFDGAWGAALAEIMTNEALSWANYLNTLPPAQPGEKRPFSPPLQFSETDWQRIQAAATVAHEASVENKEVDLSAILQLRRLFKQRSDLLQLTVNDLLILYRALHAVVYEPDPGLLIELQSLCQDNETRPAAEMALAALAPSTVNPAVVIPIDVSGRQPRDRVFPITFETPLAQLDILSLHEQSIAALDACEQDDKRYAEFDELQRTYLSVLAGFGDLLSRIKEIALAGESASVGTIKLLAHMPRPLQQLLNKIPDRFDMLNDIVKGREVISNVGAVVPDSSLTRFITSKDDNEKKTMAWGILTDAKGVMVVTLRDFRPHVAALATLGYQPLAERIAQDYLDSYVYGLTSHIHDLGRITRASSHRLSRGCHE